MVATTYPHSLSTMSNNCNDVIQDLEQRIIRLASKIYSHTNLVSQYQEEKGRLECLLENLQAQASEDDSDCGEASSDDDTDDSAPEETPTTYVITNSASAMANNGPFA